jgi:tetratricopeptide (TPR) repeat protein
MVSAKDFIDKGDNYYDDGKFREAISQYKRALNIKPDDIDVLINIGLGYRHLEEYDKAIEYYDKVLDIEPENKVAINNKGYSYECLKETDKAIELYKKSLKIDPAYDIPLVNLSNIYFNEKQYEKVIEIFDRALELDPLNSANWVDLGRAYRYLEKYDDAINSYSKALELDKHDKIAWNNIGFAFYNQKKYDKAIDAYTNSLKIDWLYDLPFTNLIKVYEKMVEENSKDSIAWKNVTYGFYVAKAYRRAMDAINRSLEIEPDFIEAKQLYKKILKDKTKYDMTPVLLDKIEDGLVLFSTISNSVYLNDIIEYIKYKSPELISNDSNFKDNEIRFKIFETIRDKGINCKLEKNKLIFYPKPIDNTKVDYMK